MIFAAFFMILASIVLITFMIKTITSFSRLALPLALFLITFSLLFLTQFIHMIVAQTVTSSIFVTIFFILLSLIPVVLFYLTQHYFKLFSISNYFFTGILAAFSLVFITIIIFNMNFMEIVPATYLANTYKIKIGGWFLFIYLLIALAIIYTFWLKIYLQLKKNSSSLQLQIILFLLLPILIYPLGIFPVINNFLLEIFLTIILFFTLILLYFAFIHSPTYKLILHLRSILHYTFLFTLMALIPAGLLFIYFSHLPPVFSLEFILLFLPCFFFLFLYYRFCFSLLGKHFYNNNQYLKPVLNSFFANIVKLQSPAQLVKNIQDLISNQIKHNNFTITIKQIEKSKFLNYTSHTTYELDELFKPIFDWFEINSDILQIQDIDQLSLNHLLKKQLLLLFQQLNACLIIPLVISDNFLGLVSISNNCNHLSTSNILFFNNAKPIISLALHNAYFYEQVHQLSRELWDINENLHDKISKKTMALEEAIDRIYSMHEEQKYFFTIASHHLRTPLTSVKASTAILWGNLIKDEFKDGLYRILAENIKRLESLIDNIIIISQLDENTLIANQQLDLHQIIYDCYHQANKDFADKKINWSFSLSNSLTSISGIKEHFRLIFSHLFSNACKFSAYSGNVSLSLQLISPDALSKYMSADSLFLNNVPHLEFSITDEGDGIPEHEIKFIFNSFRQAEESHQRYQGNGLGLFIVKRLLDFHHGMITLESKIGKGTTFSFVLPTVQPDFREVL